MTTEELKTKLENPKDLVKGKLLDEKKCKALAHALMTEFWIRKGSQHYWITDLEFYIYTDSHRDIITYPRSCEAGCWFFHDSGVDITFKSTMEFAKHPKNKKSKPKLTKDSVFGGILIRGIKPEEPLNLPDGAIYDFKGPWKSRTELFRCVDALNPDSSFPQLEPASRENKSVVKALDHRDGFPENAKEKVKSIRYNYSYWEGISEEELADKYEFYRTKPYHYSV